MRTRIKPEDLKVGEIYFTPFDPGGRVKLITKPDLRSRDFGGGDIYVEFIEDHPKGYKVGTTGCYFADELRSVE